MDLNNSVPLDELRAYILERYGEEINKPAFIHLDDATLVQSSTHSDLYHVVKDKICTCTTWRLYEKRGCGGWCGHLALVYPELRPKLPLGETRKGYARR